MNGAPCSVTGSKASDLLRRPQIGVIGNIDGLCNRTSHSLCLVQFLVPLAYGCIREPWKLRVREACAWQPEGQCSSISRPLRRLTLTAIRLHMMRLFCRPQLFSELQVGMGNSVRH